MFGMYMLNRRLWSLVAFVLTALLLSGVAVTAQGPQPQSTQAALGTGFTYQGQLKNGSAAVNGSCNMQFSLWDSQVKATGQVGATQLVPDVVVTNGLFTVVLNDSAQFGASPFNGQALWLQVAVQCGSDSGYTALSRQLLTAAPYALYAISTGALQGRVVSSGAPTSGQVLKWNGTQWSPASDNVGAVGSFWSLTGNAGTNPNTNFVGTTDNVSLTLRVSNTAALRLIPNPVSPIVLGGYSGNSVGGTYEGVTIGGGGSPNFGANVISGTNVTYSTIGGGANNRILDAANAATIGGGGNNTASAAASTLAGGFGNTASGYASTVGGGRNNTASDYASTVGGGDHNEASGANSTVSGGSTNTASGYASTVSGGVFNKAGGYGSIVPGGGGNVSAGAYSFAVGWNARAMHDGAFVWADTANLITPYGVPITSTAQDQFLVRASGGVTMYTNAGATVGATLLPGSGSWSAVSDRNAKMNFDSVDGRAVLAALASIPVETWSYKTQDASIRHIGPMAQDFRAAFGVGENDTTISTVDAQGVALAAIQGLHQVVQEKDARIAALETRVNQLEAHGAYDANTGTPVETVLFAGLALMNLLLLSALMVLVRRGRRV